MAIVPRPKPPRRSEPLNQYPYLFADGSSAPYCKPTKASPSPRVPHGRILPGNFGSSLECAMILAIKVHDPPVWSAMFREYKFNLPESDHAFDLAWVEHKVCFEVEGGTMGGKSRHTSKSGYEADCRKYNEAGQQGWIVLRAGTKMIEEDPQGLVSQIRRALESRGWGR